MTESKSTEQAGTAFVISRLVDAPRELVFRVWTEAEHLARWWGPKGCAIRAKSLDLRPGGLFHYAMVWGEDEVWAKFTFQEIAPPRRLVYVSSFSDPEGATVPPPFEERWPTEILCSVIFDEQEGMTIMTLRAEPINAGDEERATFEGGFASLEEGFGGTLDKLGEHLANLRGAR